MEQTECSETSAYKIQTPGNYPEENIQQHSSFLCVRVCVCVCLSVSVFVCVCMYLFQLLKNLIISFSKYMQLEALVQHKPQ
jgi:hypothetical protein